MKCGFTLQHYKETIELAKDKGYEITPVAKYDDQKKVIVLRHDVDWSLENAYEFANFEYDLGIYSTYYIFMHSATYSALSPKSMEMIGQMSRMGHEIGLHYDSRYSLSHEVDLLTKIIAHSISSCSQHYIDATHKETYQGILDAVDLDMKYISDSGRNWREGCLCTNIGKHKKMQVLIHPEWWVSNSTSRQDGVWKLWHSLQHELGRNMVDIKQMLFDYSDKLGIDY